MGNFADVAVDDVLGFLGEVLPPPPGTVLEVGCGRGVLAAALRGRGYRVTGLEPDPETAELARARGVAVEEVGLLDYHGGPFDVVLGTRSLHHIAALDDAVEHALRLLTPDGLLVLDEFCRERADDRAAAFFYDLRGLLYASGLAAPNDDDENDPARDPLERWRTELAPTEERALHEGEQVRTAVAARARITHCAYVPYLWRHILGTSTEEGDTWAGPAAAYLRDVERRRIAEGSLPAIGLRLAARNGHGVGTAPAR